MRDAFAGCRSATSPPGFRIPFSQPVIGPHDDGYRWLESDFGFCALARQCGYPILADTTLRLWSYGMHAQSWEDAGTDVSRYGTYSLRIV